MSTTLKEQAHARRSRGGDRRPDIQGLRAIAVLMVVAYHAGLPLPGGFVGVDVFFVISGFVITAMLQRERSRSGRIALGSFYLRRFKRLTPALALVVSVTVVASAVLLSPLGTQQTAAMTGIGAILLVANVVIARTTGGYFDAPAETNPLLHTWSLSVEEQFYLAFPVVLALSWGLARRRSMRLAPTLLVAAIATLSFLLAVLGSKGVDAPYSWLLAAYNFALGFYSPLTRAWEFAAGALLALAVSRLPTRSPRTMGVAGVVGLLLLGASVLLISSEVPFPGVWTLLPVAGAVLVIASGSGPETPIARALGHRRLVPIGDLSYSIYLWHWPFIVFAGLLWAESAVALVAAALISFIPAYASYRWLEQPIRNLPRLSVARFAPIVATTVVVPLALSAGLLYAAGSGYWSPTVRMYQDATLTAHEGERAGCDRFEPLTSQSAKRCSWNTDGTGAAVYLVGDSHADHLSEASIGAAERLGRPSVISTTSNCPFIDADFTRTNVDEAVSSRCRAKVRGTLDFLRAAAPGVVVISNTDAYWSNSNVTLGAPGEPATAENEKRLVVLRERMVSTVGTLQESGHQVVLAQTVPMWRDDDAWRPQGCSLGDVLSGRCDKTMPASRALSRHGATRDVVDSVASTTGAGVFDPWSGVCPQDICSTRGESFLRYRDDGHISVPQSEALAPALAGAIARDGWRPQSFGRR